MAKPPKTISIAFPFRDSNVVYESTFSTDRALFDFDVVVVRPYTFLSGGSGGRARVEYRQYAIAKADVESKIEDLNRLLRAGGLLIVILDVLELLQCRTGGYSLGTVYTVTNYDFLDHLFHEHVRNGSGDRVTIDPSDPFSKVIRASDVFWTAFIVGSPPYPYSDAKIFATNGRGTIVGASVSTGPGHVIFLPNFRRLDEVSFFEACVEYRERRQGTPAPDWEASVYLPGEKQSEHQIELIEEKITNLEGDRQKQLTDLGTLLAYKKLLFEKGKTQLEPIVLKALNVLDFQTSPGEIIQGTNFEIDGRTKVGSSPGIIEVKGSKNQIPLDEFGAFGTKLLADLQATGVHKKGIFVGNGLCLEKPEMRLGERVFSPHVLEAAKRNSAALVNSVELYAVVCNVLDGLITDLAAVREYILNANGYADLRSFIRKSPFKGTGT
jgi:hypothetical protein